MQRLCAGFGQLSVNISKNIIKTNSTITQQVAHMSRVTRTGRLVLTRTPGYGVNVHRSNRAKNGLFHGKDIQSGNSISHSVKHTKRKWKPNVQNKRVWSDALEGWIRFKMTTRAMRAIDDVGGIDKYLLQLDDRLVSDSNYIKKMRTLIANSLYHKGSLDDKWVRKLKYHKTEGGPPKLDITFDRDSNKWLVNGSPYLDN
jgi:large subunit ribosomal protein L28